MSFLLTSADRIIASLGRDLILINITSSGKYDPVARTSPVTTANVTFKGKVVNFEIKEINGTSIQRDDKKVILSAKDQTVVPNEKDKMRIDNKDFNIVSIRTVEENGVDLFYVLQVR